MKSVLIIAITVVFLFIPVNVYANHSVVDTTNDPDYYGKESLSFYQLFVSKDKWYSKSCEDAKNSMLHSKSVQIFQMYGYLPIYSKTDCVNVTGNLKYDKGDSSDTFGLSLEEGIKKAKDWHDYDVLLIFFDNELSKEYFKETEKIEDGETKVNYGHIQYGTKIIVSATHVDYEDDVATIQTLAHEIAHYTVSQEHGSTLATGTNETIRSKAVEDIDDWFDECFANEILNTCPELWTTVKTHYGYTIPIMSPDYVMKYAESLKPIPIEPNVTFEPIIETIPTHSPKIDNFVTYLRLTETFNGNSDLENHYEGDMLCLNYSLRDYEQPDHRFSLTVPNKIIYVSRQVVDINGNPITSYSTTGYQLDNSGNLEICEILKLYSKNYIQNGVRYKAYFSGDDTHDRTNAPTLVVYFVENPITKYSEEQERIRIEEQRQKESREQQIRELEHESLQEKLELENNGKTIGIVQWLEENYPANTLGVVRIYDSDMDFNSEVKDSFNVDVWSDSDKRGIELTVTETYYSTGIFERKVFFLTNGESSGDKLRVAVGDTITIEYEDKTLPYPYTTTDELDITATTHMTEPFCDEGTILKDGICIVEKEKEVGWFDWFWNWFQ